MTEHDPHRDDDLDEMRDKLRSLSGKRPSRGKDRGAPVTSIAKVESDRSRKNSRTKGSRGELDVAKLFSAWSGESVRRTPMSGGWSNAKFGVTADLVCPKKAFPHVEIKYREGWTLDDLVTGARADHDKSIVQWWIQCETSCPRVRPGGAFAKVPVLVFRRNRQPWLAMIGFADTERLSISLTEHVADIRALATVVTTLEHLLAQWPVPKGLKNHKRVP